VYSLKKYRQHLLGRSIIVRTNHATLSYLTKTPELIGQQGRWLDLLSEYDITIQHRRGRVHGNGDALLRRPCERSEDSDCQQCPRATRTPVAELVSSAALPADDSTLLPELLCFLPLHAQPDKSPDLPPSSSDTASNQMESPVHPVSSDEAVYASPSDDGHGMQTSARGFV